MRPVQATDDPATIGPIDLVLFCVKLWDVESAGAQIRPLIGSETAVVPLQNGIDVSERLVPILGASHVLGGVAKVTGSIVALGVIRQSGKHHGIAFGELDRQIRPRTERIRDVCQAAGIEPELSRDIQAERWWKFVGLVAVSGLCALTRRPIGDLRDDPAIAPLIDDAMREVIDVGRACGVQLASDALETWRAFVRGVPPNLTPSMAVDLRSGNRLELPWLAGKVVELGKEHGVATPVNRCVCGPETIHERCARLTAVSRRTGLGRFRILTPAAPATVSALPLPSARPRIPLHRCKSGDLVHQKSASEKPNRIMGLMQIS